MLDLVASLVMWATIEINNPEIELLVSCDRVELDINASPRAQPALVKFSIEDLRFKRIWVYRVPMERTKTGNILLEPALYWIEEIKQSHHLELEVDGESYYFNLKGSAKALKKCNGDVAQ